MSYYKINMSSGNAEALDKHIFQTEGGRLISPQEIIARNPSIVLDIADLELQTDDKLIVAREFNTYRGSIDILIITSNADVVIIETKLLKNPESHRTVVAQAIDYAKAFYGLSIKDALDKLSKNSTINKDIFEELKRNDLWIVSLEKNISTGNFQVVICGDKIHPNVLGMVESIQSAPHMAFSIYLVELDPFTNDSESIILNPRIVSKTVEIERSVIRIEIDHEKKEHSIESEIPEDGGKGPKPILKPSEYLDNLSRQEFKKTIEKLWDDWGKMGGDIRFGTAGLSLGLIWGDRRVAPFFIYLNRVPILSEKYRSSLNVPDDLYQQYKEDLKRSQVVYDGYCVGNKVEVPFDEITVDDLEVIFNSAINLGKKLLNE